MSMEGSMRALSARVIVVGNEKGGSGKSTVAMHIAIALIKSGQAVATVDLDTRQKSLTAHIENRRAWARHVGRDLDMPEHFCFGKLDYPTAEEEAAGCGRWRRPSKRSRAAMASSSSIPPVTTTICRGSRIRWPTR